MCLKCFNTSKLVLKYDPVGKMSQYPQFVYYLSFLSFKKTTHAYLLQTSITHNKKQNSLLYLLINCISADSVAEILSLKDEYIFRFSIFLIIDLCYNFAFCTNTRRVFIKTFLNHWGNSALICIIFWIFSNIKCFIANILSEAVLLGKCLRSP